MPTPAQDIEAIRESLGPKRVKTPQIEIEQFDLDQLDRIAQKSSTFKPSFNNFLFAKAVPKYGMTCERETSEYTPESPPAQVNVTQMKTLNNETLLGTGNITILPGTSFVVDESLIGIINGSNATFSTSLEFEPGQVQVFLNGVAQEFITDFTTIGTTQIVFTSSPEINDVLMAIYQKRT